MVSVLLLASRTSLVQCLFVTIGLLFHSLGSTCHVPHSRSFRSLVLSHSSTHKLPPSVLPPLSSASACMCVLGLRPLPLMPAFLLVSLFLSMALSLRSDRTSACGFSDSRPFAFIFFASSSCPRVFHALFPSFQVSRTVIPACTSLYHDHLLLPILPNLDFLNLSPFAFKDHHRPPSPLGISFRCPSLPFVFHLFVFLLSSWITTLSPKIAWLDMSCALIGVYSSLELRVGMMLRIPNSAKTQSSQDS